MNIDETTISSIWNYGNIFFYKLQHHAYLFQPPPKKPFIYFTSTSKPKLLKLFNTEFWWSMQCSPTEETIY